MSTKRIKTMTVFGTRPEAIKMAPVIRELEEDGRFENVVVVTAQHRDMLDQAMDVFGIVPDYDLNVMRHGQTLSDIAVRCLQRLEEPIRRESPHMMLVHGDTLTSFIAGLAGFFNRIPIAHVEAGLRTGDPYNPFPEEMNRRLTAALASLHFAPTEGARTNLLRESIQQERVFLVGNTVIDSLMSEVRQECDLKEYGLPAIDFENRRVLLVTTHRRENLGEPMRRIFSALLTVVQRFPDVEVVFPLHKNPAVRLLANEVLAGHERIHLIEPPPYRAFAHLMAKSYIVMTDSGGIQEEAPALGKPVLVLRDTTERPEGVSAGTCLQVGTESGPIVDAASKLLTSQTAYEEMAKAINPYGDGQAADRIKEAIAWWFGLTQERPQDFSVGLG